MNQSRRRVDYLPQEEWEEYWESEPLVQWRWVLGKALLLLEVGAVLFLAWLLLDLWRTLGELNEVSARLQREAVQQMVQPAAPLLLPSGHEPPRGDAPPQPGEAGVIPPGLWATLEANGAWPTPTPGVEQARRIQIPALDVDAPVYQGDGWEQLKRGVGQYAGSPPPGQEGNLVLSGHNDIFGAVFRHLDDLEAGDEVVISSGEGQYRYRVRETVFVEPTDTWVMLPTPRATVTLISCYPYLLDTERIVVFADLVQ